MSTCPFPCLESSPTSSHLSKPCMRKKNQFSKQNLLFSKTHYRISVKQWTTLRGKLVGELSETVMVLIRDDLLDYLPTQFSGKSFCEIPFATIFVFQKIHVMHSHLISRLPGTYEMHYVISTIFIPIYQIYNILKFALKPHVIQCLSTITQTSSLEQITILSPMSYTQNYIPYNCDIMLTHQAYTLTY